VLTETLQGPAGEFGPQVNVTVGALGQEVVPPGPTGVVGQLEAGTVTVVGGTVGQVPPDDHDVTVIAGGRVGHPETPVQDIQINAEPG
jgi:hypothetical protein